MATLDENELELQQTLEEAFPNFDWSAGTAFYEQIVKPWAVNLTDRDEAVQLVKDNMSLVQVLNSDNPDDEAVDLLLSNYNITRNEGSVSTGFMSVYFSGANSLSISPGTTITCANTSFRPTKTYIGVVGTITEEDTEEVAYIQAVAISESEYVFAIEVQSTEVTSAILGPGQECSSDLSSSFLQRIITASTFSGGSLPETTASLLERAKLGITTSSSTGKDNIRSLVMDSPYNVQDSQVFGFGDDVQLRDTHNNAGIAVGGRADVYVSTDVLIQKVLAQLTATRVEGTRWKVDIPEDLYAGAYGVGYIMDGISLIDTPLEHEVSFFTSDDRPAVDNPTEARYSKYQLLSVYFYDENTLDTAETEKVYTVQVLYMPNIDDLQDYVEDPDIQSATADLLVKAFVPIEISVGVTVDYAQGVVPPDASELQSAVAAAINGKLAGSSQMPASDVVYAVKNAFPECTVRMPIALLGKVFLPSGQIGYDNDNDNIEVPAGILGVEPGNTKFFSSPDIISISLNEAL